MDGETFEHTVLCQCAFTFIEISQITTTACDDPVWTKRVGRVRTNAFDGAYNERRNFFIGWKRTLRSIHTQLRSAACSVRSREKIEFPTFNFPCPTSHFLLSFPFVLYDFPIPISKSRRPTSQLPHSSQISRFPLLPESIPITMSGPKSPNFPKSPSSSFPLLSQDGPIPSSNCSTFSIPLSFQESSPPPVLISTSSTTPSLLHTCLSAN
jgi:hypothetical protein